MTRMKLIIASATLLVVPVSVYAAKSAVLHIHFDTCDCSVTARLDVLVDISDPYDVADDIQVGVYSCSFCTNPLNGTTDVDMTPATFPAGPDHWGGTVANIWAGEYSPQSIYYAKSGNDFTWKDTSGGTNEPNVPAGASKSGVAPTGGEGGCLGQ